MVALLAERLIERKLNNVNKTDTDLPKTAAALFEELSSVQLNRLCVGGKVTSLRTETTPEIMAILKQLGIEDVLDSFPTTASFDKSGRRH